MTPLQITVLRGGPDKERPVSFESGKHVAIALRNAGHRVTEADILPDDLTALDAFEAATGDVIFPVLHGPWGEGGPLQRILDERNLCYVGSRCAAASLCIDKNLTKQKLIEHHLPTPPSAIVRRGETSPLKPPVVVKAINEGSSFDLAICRDEQAVSDALARLHDRHERLLVEQFIQGMEITVGILGNEALPPIRIVPATGFYDYEAKYTRDDTQYLFDTQLPESVLAAVAAHALAAHQLLGCRHLSRVDFMIDQQNQPWILELNTLPGFTTHSLLPKAAGQRGLDMTALTERLVRMAIDDQP